jgi:hypothetical protein
MRSAAILVFLGVLALEAGEKRRHKIPKGPR